MHRGINLISNEFYRLFSNLKLFTSLFARIFKKRANLRHFEADFREKRPAGSRKKFGRKEFVVFDKIRFWSLGVSLDFILFLRSYKTSPPLSP